MASPYGRRIHTSRREIVIALALTLAAIVLIVGAFLSRVTTPEIVDPVALQTPIVERR